MSGQQQRLSGFVYAFAGAEDLAEFRDVVTRGIRSVVAADLASYTEVDLATGQASAPHDPVIDAAEPTAALGRLAHQHPLITRQEQHAESISDYLSARQFHALALYQEVYRPLEAEDQLAIILSVETPKVIGLALNRSKRGFSGRDRNTLDLLRPLLSNSYQRICARERATELLWQLCDGEAEQPVGVIALDRHRRIAFASDHVDRWLRSYFGTSRGANLPEALADWLSAKPAEATTKTAFENGRGRLEITLLPNAPSEPVLLELREHLHPSAGARLTTRERQIMELAASGAANKQIADQLRISQRTVANHLSSIYRKFGVKNRTAAAAAFNRLGSAPPSF